MQKTLSRKQSTINFTIDEVEKQNLFKRAALRGMTLSQFIRYTLSENANTTKKPNTLLKLAGFMSDVDAMKHNEAIYSSRKSKLN